MKSQPQEGSVESFYIRLNNYISQFDAEWNGRIEGVSKKQMDKLIGMIEQQKPEISLPQDYMQYLRIMGNNNGGILSEAFVHNLKAEYDIVMKINSELLEEEWYRMDKQSMAAFYLDVTGDYYFLYFDSDSSYVIGDDRDADSEEFELVSESMEKLIFQSAYRKYEPMNFEYGQKFSIEDIKYTENAELFHKLKEICAKFGMSPLWISDKANYFFEGENGLLCVNRYSTVRGMAWFCSEKIQIEFIKELQSDDHFKVYWSKG